MESITLDGGTEGRLVPIGFALRRSSSGLDAWEVLSLMESLQVLQSTGWSEYIAPTLPGTSEAYAHKLERLGDQARENTGITIQLKKGELYCLTHNTRWQILTSPSSPKSRLYVYQPLTGSEVYFTTEAPSVL